MRNMMHYWTSALICLRVLMLQDRRKQFISLDCIQWVLGELEEKTTVRFAYCSKKVVPELIWVNKCKNINPFLYPLEFIFVF